MKASGFKVTTAPVSEPFSAAEMRNHIRVTVPAENNLISEYIAAARNDCENFCERSILTQTIKAYFDDWPPADRWISGGIVERNISPYFELPRPPVQSVTAIRYYDSNGVQQTLGLSIVLQDLISEPARIYLAPNQSWPSIQNRSHAIEVEYVGGWANEGAVPPLLKQGMRWRAAQMFEFRTPIISGHIVQEIPMSVRSCWAPYRIGSA